MALSYSYSSVTNSYSVASNSCTAGAVVIPSSYNGVNGSHPVTSIGNQAFIVCTSLTSITIPNTVTSIGVNAFSSCTNLTSVIFEDDSTLTIMKEASFSNCNKLTNITIPSSVISLESSNFAGCTLLSSVIFESNGTLTDMGNATFEGCTSLSSINIPSSITSIGDQTFRGCSSLTSIIIPDGVISLGDFAFSNCSSLLDITIPSSVNSIGIEAFLECVDLESVTFESGSTLSSIPNDMFNGCISLTSVNIPNSVISIGNFAFYVCGSLTTTIPNGVTGIGIYAFYNCTSLTTTIPNSVTSIGDYAFYNCTSLTTTIPNSLTSIGYGAFSSCTSLTSITIPNSLTSIANSAFNSCTSLTSVTIPNSVTSLGQGAFQNCTSLTSVTIPVRVTSIGANAFMDCTSLTKVNFLGNASTLGSNVFLNSPCTIYRYSTKSGWSSSFGGKSVLLIDSNIHKGLQTFGFSVSSGKASIKKSNLGTGRLIAKVFVPADLNNLQLWLKGDSGVSTSSGTKAYISQIVFSGFNPNTSNGTYTRTSGGSTSFLSGSNEIFYFDSLDAWILYDADYDGQTFISYGDLQSWEAYDGYDAGSVTTTNSYISVLNVTAWADQSGNNRNFTKSIANTAFPTYVNSTILFTASAAYDASDASILALPSANLNFTTPYTLIAVVRAAGANAVVFSKSNDDGKRRKYQISINGGIIYSLESKNGLDTNISYNTGGGNNVNTKRLIISQYSSNTNGLIRYNGSQVATGNTDVGIDQTNSASIFIGASAFNEGVGYNAEASREMYVYEIIFYNRALSLAEMQKIEKYLNRKHNIY